jgi:hypothetical protein
MAINLGQPSGALPARLQQPIHNKPVQARVRRSFDPAPDASFGHRLL